MLLDYDNTQSHNPRNVWKKHRSLGNDENRNEGNIRIIEEDAYTLIN